MWFDIRVRIFSSGPLHQLKGANLEYVHVKAVSKTTSSSTSTSHPLLAD